MNRHVDGDADVMRLAEDLGLGRPRSPSEAIAEHCLSRIKSWVEQAGGISTAAELERLVCSKLQLVIEAIETDGDLRLLVDKYARTLGEPVFADAANWFGGEEYGVLVGRRNAGPADPDLFVAIIDCRGDKWSRRFFTRWHEIAHRMTTHATDGQPVFRAANDPIEVLMDLVASRIGFYPPLLVPALDDATAGGLELSFNVIEGVRSRAFPEASFHATLRACVREVEHPAVYLTATRCRGDDTERDARGLCTLAVAPNAAAKQQRTLFIPVGKPVPSTSSIHRAFESDSDEEGEEDLHSWPGQARATENRVKVQARRLFDRVIAVVRPA